MGAWGEGPLDSDQALDWLANEITDHAGRKIDDLIDSFNNVGKNWGWDSAADRYGHELRAAAYVLETLNYFSDRLFGDMHARMADALNELRGSEWMLGWSDPDAIRAMVDEQIEAMRRGQQPTTLLDNQ